MRPEDTFSKAKKSALQIGSALQKLNMYLIGMPFYFFSRWMGLALIAIYGTMLVVSASTHTIVVLLNPETAFKYKDTIVGLVSVSLAVSALLVAYCLTMVQIAKNDAIKLHFLTNSSRFMLGTMKLIIALAVILLTTTIAKTGNFPVLLKDTTLGYIFYAISFLAATMNIVEGFTFTLRGFSSVYNRVSFDLLLLEGEKVDEAHKKYME